MLLLTTQPIAHQTNIYRMLHAEKSEFQENSACKHAHELALENMLKGTQSSILCAWGRNLWATSFTTTHWWVLDSSLNKKRSREQQDARAPYAGKTPQTVHWWKRLFSFYYSSLCMYIVCMHFGVFFFFWIAAVARTSSGFCSNKQSQNWAPPSAAVERKRCYTIFVVLELFGTSL